MAVGKISLSLDATEIQQLRSTLGKVFGDNAELSKILGEALKKAIVPAYERLKEITPVGPTGNLKRAVNQKIVKYPRDGTAVGLVGYNRAGDSASSSAAGGTVKAGRDRAFHQWIVEYGSKERIVDTFSNKPYQRKSHVRRMRSGKVATVREHTVSGQNAYIASSFKRLGPFQFTKTPRAEEGQRVQTDPPYPNAFFKKSKNPIRIAPMPAGGSAGVSPVQTAWNQTRGQVAEILQRELALSLEAALQKLSFSSTGSVTGATIQAGG